MVTYLILSIDRRNTAQQAGEVVDLAVKFRKRGVVGIDLCGDPAKGDVSSFRPAFAKAREAGLKIILHFAEIAASSSEKELETLLSFQPDRLGHVIHVPEGIERDVEQKRLGLELCVSCNVQAGLTSGGVVGHHFGRWMKGDCRIILCVSAR